MGRSIDDAIAGILDGAPAAAAGPEPAADEDAPEEAPDVPFDPEGRSVVELMALAEQFLVEADAAERNGQDEVAEDFRARALEALGAAQQLLSGSAASPQAASSST